MKIKLSTPCGPRKTIHVDEVSLHSRGVQVSGAKGIEIYLGLEEDPWSKFIQVNEDGTFVHEGSEYTELHILP